MKNMMIALTFAALPMCSGCHFFANLSSASNSATLGTPYTPMQPGESLEEWDKRSKEAAARQASKR